MIVESPVYIILLTSFVLNESVATCHLRSVFCWAFQADIKLVDCKVLLLYYGSKCKTSAVFLTGSKNNITAYPCS